ncbi:MAG: hypothetical protein ACK5IP_11255, partial [Paracoccus sp. (in: a-proteobacteria)]
MPPPTFDLPINGTAPNQYATEGGLEAAVNTALSSMWDGLETNAGRVFDGRQAAVEFGQANLPSRIGMIAVRNGYVIEYRIPGEAVDDPLFATVPRWGVVARVDVPRAMREGGVLTLANIGGGTNAITADLTPVLTALGVTVGGLSIVELTPNATNTSAVTLNVAGDGVRTVLTETGTALPAGYMVAGRSYLLRRRGNGWRIITGGVARDDVRADNLTGYIHEAAVVSLDSPTRVGLTIPGGYDLTALDRARVVVTFGFASPASMTFRMNGVVASDRPVTFGNGDAIPAGYFQSGSRATFIYR